MRGVDVFVSKCALYQTKIIIGQIYIQKDISKTNTVAPLIRNMCTKIIAVD